MAASLFDNRYRYDYIYPRGRSGETLRAVDMQDNERRVVIKRPAPGDAPPIRAGQEVSILNEKKALKRLAGHPVLTELLGEGTFGVGGTAHQYIVIERAEGLIIGDLVAELAAAGERIPELEMLVIVDAMLDLLRNAHARDIVYNDVDSRHLFWNRTTYRLKMIDWGNAVFLEGDTITPQGISRQTDIYQAGELLFFILSGGRRADIPRDAGADFAVDFGDDSSRVLPRLQEIVSRALHPGTRFRYPSVTELRNDLAKYRAPLEQQRNLAVGQVTETLRQTSLTRSHLRDLLATLEPALARDPGYPPARSAAEDIHNRLRDLNVDADLDAVRIYMEGHNWPRAADLLREIEDKAGPRTGSTVRLLLDICLLLTDNQVQPAPEMIMQALAMIFDGKAAGAATMLLLDTPDDNGTRTLEWQIAERISSHIPEVLLLRPNLFRLTMALRALAIDGYAVQELRTLLAEVDKLLDVIAAGPTLNLNQLRDRYRTVVEQLNALNRLLQTFAVQHQLSLQRVPLNALDRAINAAMALADNMHIIGRQAASTPRNAMQALDNSRLIDPPGPHWDALEALLDSLYDRLEHGHRYVPAADGTDLQDWLTQMATALAPFTQQFADEGLAGIVRDLERAASAWHTYCEVILQGDKDSAHEALQTAATAVASLSPALSQWFQQLAGLINTARYVERHSVPGGIGRALADGWQAFDRSQMADAEHLARQAYESARTEAGQFAAQRLLELARHTAEWVERGGVNNADKTAAVLRTVEQLFTPDEKALLDNFTAQMPSIETYLKAMSRGLVAVCARRSTAALRLLYTHYVMLSAQDAAAGLADDSAFWREAALKTLPEADRHITLQTRDQYVARRQDLQAAADVFDQIHGRDSLPRLPELRRRLEENPQAKLLQPGIGALREVEAALRDWSEGEFKAAGVRLEAALRAIQEQSAATGMALSNLKTWLMTLMSAAAELHVQFRELRARIDSRPDAPDDVVERAHQTMLETTQALIGEAYTGTLRQWHDTCAAFVAAYRMDDRRSRRLERFNELFRAMFIDRHPAYALYRHWYMVLENASEFPAPATDDPMPRIETYVVAEDAYRGQRYQEGGRLRRIPRSVLIGAAGVVAAGLLLALLIAVFGANNPAREIAVTISATPATDMALAAVTEEAAPATLSPATPAPTQVPTLPPTDRPTEAPFNTPLPPVFATNTATPLPATTVAPTATPPASATPTLTPSVTFTPSPTFTPSITPSVTPSPLPPQGVQGEQDLLLVLNRAPELPYNPALFSPVENGWRMGTGVAASGQLLVITPPVELLEQAFGNNAAARIRRVEADLTLAVYNPDVVSASDIYFGVLLQSINDGTNAGIQLQVVDNNVITLTRLLNNDARFLNQRSVNTIIARLRIDRDVNNGELRLYFNDIPMGEAFSFLPPDAPLLPGLFVREGGVVVTVTSWKVTLR
ncbi:MAG: hypothetical protein MUE40_17050 [Anaerolineae bacterium]|nr:hypothetical protein [Anaerolineae bacterium]